MRCKGCDYPIRGLRTPRCPECGREFEMGKPTTYVRPITRRPWHNLVVVAAVSYLAPLLALVPAGLLSDEIDVILPWVFFAAIIWPITFWITYILYFQAQYMVRVRRARRRLQQRR